MHRFVLALLVGQEHERLCWASTGLTLVALGGRENPSGLSPSIRPLSGSDTMQCSRPDVTIWLDEDMQWYASAGVMRARKQTHHECCQPVSPEPQVAVWLSPAPEPGADSEPAASRRSGSAGSRLQRRGSPPQDSVGATALPMQRHRAVFAGGQHRHQVPQRRGVETKEAWG